MTSKYELTETEAELLFKLVKNECDSYKNWTITAVEENKFNYAQKLVCELREYQKLFSKLNIEAHRAIEAGKAGF